MKNEKRPVFRCVRCGREIIAPTPIDIRNGYVWHGACVPRDPAELSRVIAKVERRSSGEQSQLHRRVREPKVVLAVRVPTQFGRVIQRMVRIARQNGEPKMTKSRLLRHLFELGYQRADAEINGKGLRNVDYGDTP